MAFDDAVAAAEEPALFDEEDFHVDMEQVAERIEAERIEADSAPRPVQITFEWTLAPDSARRMPVVPDSTRLNPTLVEIEDFGTPDSSRLRAFYDTLLCARRPVRIAVLGDSFIEGDILTADLRERLQQAYGGGGAGFAPMASPLTAFRRTIKTQSKGWTSYNIMQRKAAPQNLRENFYVSGWVCPACGRRFDPLGKYRLPQAARHLHRGAGLLHQPRRKPRGADAQRLAGAVNSRSKAPRTYARSPSRLPTSARSRSRCSPATRDSSATARYSKPTA